MVRSAPPVAIVAARMSSKRLPGKPLMRFGGEALLGHVVGAVKQVQGLSGVVVATSHHEEDDAIAAWCRRTRTECWRGSRSNVAQRLLDAALSMDSEAFLRVSGDSPMIDPVVLEAAVRLYRCRDVDLATNLNPRTLPRGQSAEVVRVSALSEVLGTGNVSHADREHVTRALYRTLAAVRIARLRQEEVSKTRTTKPPYPRLTVDTEGDAARFRRILELAAMPSVWHLGWERCVELARLVEAHDPPSGNASL